MRHLGRAIVFVLALAVPASADPRESAEIDLGTATLDRREISLGLVRVQAGAHERLTVGSFAAPWSLMILNPDTQVANGFAKLRVFRRGRLSGSLRSGIIWAALDDLDGDGLDARLLIVPSNARLGVDIDERWSLTAGLTFVYATAAAERLDESDTEIGALAVARAAHTAATVRLRLSSRWTLWARARVVLDHAPVTADANLRLSPTARAEARARANQSDLSTAGSIAAGFLATFGRLNLRLGVGYGHWVVPMVELPVGDRIPSADFDLYWRL